MSKRGWRKFKDEKLRRKAERKQEIKRANAVTAGRLVGPGGFALVESPCPSCDYPTTEVWSLSTGETGCERCTERRSDALFAVVREVRGEHIVSHVVTVEAASAGTS